MNLSPNACVALTACSNPLPRAEAGNVLRLCDLLREMGLTPILSPCLYGDLHLPRPNADREKAAALEAFYRDERIRAIFDLSGGDLANGVLSYLDMDCVRTHPKPFFGYSDLTCILNAIYAQTGQTGGLYSLRNLLREAGELQRVRLEAFLFARGAELLQPSFRFVQGSAMEGTLVGGNLRCLLKLAGTSAFPDLTGKLLFLESRGGELPQISTMLHQLRQMGAFDRVSGVLLGTFTQYQQRETLPVTALVCAAADRADLPIAKTEEVGHGADARCLLIGARCRCTAEGLVYTFTT